MTMTDLRPFPPLIRGGSADAGTLYIYKGVALIPLSCSNCCYNGLQYGSLGLSVGYCVEHRVVLRRADETTCPRHLRKDLDAESREVAHQHHERRFPQDLVQLIRPAEIPADASTITDRNPELLETDAVGEVVSNYGILGSKYASLAQLREISGVRAELAMLSLGRSYVRRCLSRQGPWTSGLNLLWWTRKRIAEKPRIGISDLRYQASASLERQAELEAWSMVMLRLTFVADVGSGAPQDEPVSALAGVLEEAAGASDVPDLEAVLLWVRDKCEPFFDSLLPTTRYREIKERIHRETPEAD